MCARARTHKSRARGLKEPFGRTDDWAGASYLLSSAHTHLYAKRDRERENEIYAELKHQLWKRQGEISRGLIAQLATSIMPKSLKDRLSLLFAWSVLVSSLFAAGCYVILGVRGFNLDVDVSSRRIRNYFIDVWFCLLLAFLAFEGLILLSQVRMATAGLKCKVVEQ